MERRAGITGKTLHRKRGCSEESRTAGQEIRCSDADGNKDRQQFEAIVTGAASKGTWSVSCILLLKEGW